MTESTKAAPVRAWIRRGGVAFAVFILWSSAGLAFGPSVAFGHDQLLSSTPAANAVLETAPSEVTLVYSDSVLTIGAIVLLVDKDEKNWIVDEPTLEGPIVTAYVSGDLPDGAYEIRWRVVSIDGHPISDIIPFTIGDGEPSSLATPSAPSSTSSSTGADDTTGAATTTEANGEFMRPVLVGIGGAAAALLLLWGVTVWNRRRRRRTNTTSQTPTS